MKASSGLLQAVQIAEFDCFEGHANSSSLLFMGSEEPNQLLVLPFHL
jgi:hypothetical protein